MTSTNFTTAAPRVDILDDHTAYLIAFLLTFFIIPAISIFGIMGNIVNMVILSKHGISKESNPLLFGLAVSDTCFLIGYNNIPKMMYDFGAVEGFDYPKGTSTALFILYEFFDILDWGGGYVSFVLPMLITVERLFAVFLPLHFKSIVTAKRLHLAVGAVYFIFVSYIVYIRCWFVLEFEFDATLNRSIGVIRRSQIYHDQKDAAAIMADVINVVLHQIPLVGVVLGCTAIGIKLRLQQMERKKLTSSSKDSQNRTTKTLLAVCAVYTVTCIFSQLPSYFPQYMYYAAYSDEPSNLADVIYRALNMMIAINSSCNFIIYVFMNPKFRATYMELFCKRRRSN